MDETRTLADGTRVALRAIRPDDAEKLRLGFHALSPASRYQRFMGQVADLTPAMLEYLTRVDGIDHLALVAMRLDHEEREQELVAVARSIRLAPGGKVAEVAITVGDRLHGMGLGTCMMHSLVELGRRHGVEAFVAHALPGNVAIRRLLEAHGTVTESGDRTLHVALGARRRWTVPVATAWPSWLATLIPHA